VGPRLCKKTISSVGDPCTAGQNNPQSFTCGMNCTVYDKQVTAGRRVHYNGLLPFPLNNCTCEYIEKSFDSCDGACIPYKDIQDVSCGAAARRPNKASCNAYCI